MLQTGEVKMIKILLKLIDKVWSLRKRIKRHQVDEIYAYGFINIRPKSPQIYINPEVLRYSRYFPSKARFIGKLLIEILLRNCTSITYIYLLFE